MNTADDKSLQVSSEVLLLIDWENVFFSLFKGFGPDKMSLDYRFERLMEWIKDELGELLGGHGFIFAPEHFSICHRKICVKNRLRIMICPKRQNGDEVEDTVDETIIWFGKVMLKHPNVKFICLVSGDQDYVPLLQESQKNGVKIALVAPTLDSLSTNKVMVKLIDTHPESGKKMALVLSRV